jgi:hypothetical protein
MEAEKLSIRPSAEASGTSRYGVKPNNEYSSAFVFFRLAM